MSIDTFSPKTANIYFIVKNISPLRKRLTIFNAPIEYNSTRDLLALPSISEADIRHSLIKGELCNRLKNRDIIITSSNIDLLQFSDDQKQFLKSYGVSLGTELTSTIVPYDDSKSLPAISASNVQDALDYIKANLTIDKLNKLRVGKSGAVDYETIHEAIDYAVSQGACSGSPWEIIIDPGEYIEPSMTVCSGIIITNDADVSVVSVVAEDPNADLFTCTGGYISGITASGVTNTTKYLFKCATSNILVVFNNISVKQSYNGFLFSNGAKGIISNLLVYFTAANQEMNNVIKVTGTDSFVNLVDSSFVIFDDVLALYTSNPIQRCISVNDSSKINVSSCVFRVLYKDTTSDVFFADGESIVDIMSTTFIGCNICNHIGSLGDNTQIVLQSCSFTNNNYNGKIDSATGAIFTNLSVDDTHYTGVPGATLAGLVQYKNEKKMRLLGDIGYRFITGSDLNLPDYLSDNASSGVSFGGIVTATTGLNISVSAGSGWIKRGIPYDDVYQVTWSISPLLLTASSNNYIVYDSASSSIISQLVPASDIQIKLAEVVTSVSGIRFIHILRNPISSPAQLLQNYLLNTRKLALNSGLLVVAGSTNNKITVGSGSYYIGIDLISYSGSGTDGYFNYFYGSDGYIETTSTNTIDDLKYDLSNTLTTLVDGYYKIDTLYLTSDGRLSLVYGNSQYETIDLARSGSIPTVPTFLQPSAFALMKIVSRKGLGISELIDIRAQPASALGSGTVYAGIVDHSLLFNLDVDSHTQYLLASGTRPLSGNLDLGGNNITNINVIDGVDVSSHAIRHRAGGIDGLTVASPIAILAGVSPSEGDGYQFSRANHQHGIAVGTPSSIGTSNIIGSSTSVAAADHVHAHGNQTSGTLHAAVVSEGTSGFMTGADKKKLDDIPTEIVKSILMWGNKDIITTTATRYLTPGYDSHSATSSAIQFAAPISGTAKNMYVRHNTGDGNGNAIVYTLRKNNVVTSLSVSIASTANNGSDLVHTVSLAAGDLIDIEVTKSSAISNSPDNILVSIAIV